MNNYKILILLIFLFPFSVFSDSFILNEVNEPKTLNVSGDKLVISESETVLIYSLSKKELIKKFGKNGEGPGEFKLGHGAGSLKIDIMGNELIVNSGGKISWFTQDGEFIREDKIPPMTYLIPVNKNFIGNCLSPVKESFPSLSVCLFDGQMKKTETIFNSEVPVGMGAKMMVPAYNFIYRVYKDRIFLSSGKENIEIRIFSFAGKEEGRFLIKNPQLPITGDFKSRVYDFYKNDPIYKNYWSYMKKNMFFPEFFPGLKDMRIKNDNIYIQTYKMADNKFEWIITDLKGKLQKKILLPQNIESAIAYSPIAISNGKYYYLTEDIDKETWELHLLDLEQ